MLYTILLHYVSSANFGYIVYRPTYKWRYQSVNQGEFTMARLRRTTTFFFFFYFFISTHGLEALSAKLIFKGVQLKTCNMQ